MKRACLHIPRDIFCDQFTDAGIFAGLSSGAAYTAVCYLGAENSQELTLFLCPGLRYRYAAIVTNIDPYLEIPRVPLWISTLDQLAPPLCAMA